MAKKTPNSDPTQNIPQGIGCKLRKLIIRNFGCIGDTPVEIDLDDVVVLVGANNTGKSTILHAYDVLFSSSSPKISIEDFPECQVKNDALPQIELHTKVTDKPPGHRWIGEVGGENIVRERWTWSQPDTPAQRQGFDVVANEWSGQVPWGAPNVANARRPKPHRIEAFASPEKQTEAVTKLLMATLQSRVKEAPLTTEDDEGQEVETDYGKLIATLGEFQKSVVEDAQQQIDEAQQHMTTLVQNVFHGYEIEFDAKPEEDLTTCLNFFKPGATLRMGPAGGHKSAAEKQGSGARRTLMWAALQYEAESKAPQTGSQSNMLLLDEPELCLHPNAIRQACSVLYDLPGTTAGKSW